MGTHIPMYLRPSVSIGVGLSGRQTIGLSDYRAVRQSGCRTIGSSDYRAVGILGLNSWLNSWLVGWLVGWLVVLRIYGALVVFQPYRDMEAGDNQSL